MTMPGQQDLFANEESDETMADSNEKKSPGTKSPGTKSPGTKSPEAKSPEAKGAKKRSGKSVVNAETMAKKQREISVSEFFTKNRHLLGFDSPRKALLTAVKEAVDNSLDACEEARILPDLKVTDHAAVAAFCAAESVGLVVVGPEAVSYTHLTLPTN